MVIEFTKSIFFKLRIMRLEVSAYVDVEEGFVRLPIVRVTSARSRRLSGDELCRRFIASSCLLFSSSLKMPSARHHEPLFHFQKLPPCLSRGGGIGLCRNVWLHNGPDSSISEGRSIHKGFRNARGSRLLVIFSEAP